MYASLVLAAAVCILLCAILPNHRRNLLTGAFCGLLLGWRGLQLLPEIRIFPSELFLWVAFLLCLGEHDQPVQAERRSYGWALSLFFVSLISILTAMFHEHLNNEAIVESKTFVVFLPTLVVFRHWIRSWQDSDRYEGLFTLVCTGIAGLGVVERMFPQISAIAPSLFPSPISTRLNFAQTGLVRLAGFSFWGGPIVAVILVPALGMAVSRTFLASGKQRKFWGVASVILAAGIFVAGYRSAWLGAIIALSIWFTMGRGSAKMAIVVFSIVLLLVVPAQFADRFRTILAPRESGDLSLLERERAARQGLEAVRDNPVFGTGWGSRTTFNDWLYLTVVMGLPGLLLFAGWYAGTFRKVLIATRSADPRTRTMAIGYFSGLAGYAVSMLSGAMSQVPPLTTAFWMFFLLALRFSELAAIQAKTMQDLPYAIRVPFPLGVPELTARRGA